MGNNYRIHYTKLTDPVLISKATVERGMVVKLAYKKDNKLKEYLVLVLQPRWPNATDGKLHGLSLDEINLSKFKKLSESYREILSTSPRIKKLDIAKIRINESSKVFYTNEIRDDKDLRIGYRTFDLKKIKSIFAYNYNWGKFDRIPPK